MLHRTSLRAAQAVMLVLSLCGGIIVIGSLGAATNMCRENAGKLLKGELTDQEIIDGLSIVASNHLQPFPADPQNPDPAYDCGIHVSLEWWLVGYEVFTFIYGMLAVFVNFFHCKPSVMSIFSIKVTLATIITSVYVKIAYMFNGGAHSDNAMGQYTKTATAGGLIICVANYFFLFLFGADEDDAESTPAIDSKA